MLRSTRFLASFLGLLLIAGCSAEPESIPEQEEDPASDVSPEPESGLEPSPEVQELLPDNLRDEGEITIVGTQGSPPTSYYDDESGNADGLNPDIARAIGDIMGLETEVTLTTTDGLVPGLQSGMYDMAVASLSPSSERLEVLDMVAFTKGGSAIAVPEGNPDSLTSRDLCGLKVGVSTGSYQATDRLPLLNKEECASQNEPDIEAVALPDQAQTLLALSTNRVDAVMADGPVLGYAQLERDGSFEVLEDESNLTSTGGMAAEKDSELTQAITVAMEVLHDSPEYAAIYEKWGMSEYMLPDNEMGRLEG